MADTGVTEAGRFKFETLLGYKVNSWPIEFLE